jgi:hypothetical protein
MGSTGETDFQYYNVAANSNVAVASGVPRRRSGQLVMS